MTLAEQLQQITEAADLPEPRRSIAYFIIELAMRPLFEGGSFKDVEGALFHMAGEANKLSREAGEDQGPGY
jgi:hypothetical protein